MRAATSLRRSPLSTRTPCAAFHPPRRACPRLARLRLAGNLRVRPAGLERTFGDSVALRARPGQWAEFVTLLDSRDGKPWHI
jgi:hypothetical protein